MNNSLKGAFLSGLVFPGLGQVVLKRYTRGIVLMLAVSFGLFVLVAKAVHQALAILEKIESGGGVLTMSAISEAAAEVSTTSDSLIFNFALLSVLLCWIIGIIDAYIIGKKRDLEERPSEQPSSTEGN